MPTEKVYSCIGLNGRYCATRFSKSVGFVSPFLPSVPGNLRTVAELEAGAICDDCARKYSKLHDGKKLARLVDAIRAVELRASYDAKRRRNDFYRPPGHVEAHYGVKRLIAKQSA